MAAPIDSPVSPTKAAELAARSNRAASAGSRHDGREFPKAGHSLARAFWTWIIKHGRVGSFCRRQSPAGCFENPHSISSSLLSHDLARGALKTASPNRYLCLTAGIASPVSERA